MTVHANDTVRSLRQRIAKRAGPVSGACMIAI
jgi:hypothetical protein